MYHVTITKLSEESGRSGWNSMLVLIFVAASVLLVSGPGSALGKDATVSLSAITSSLGPEQSLEGKVVYVDFWASWCQPCRMSFPWLKDLSARYGERGLQVVTINLDKERPAAEKFLNELKVDLKVIYDSDGKLAKQFQVDAMPTSFVFARDGSLKDRHRGFHEDDRSELDSLINTLLTQKVEE